MHKTSTMLINCLEFKFNSVINNLLCLAITRKAGSNKRRQRRSLNEKSRVVSVASLHRKSLVYNPRSPGVAAQ